MSEYDSTIARQQPERDQDGNPAPDGRGLRDVFTAHPLDSGIPEPLVLLDRAGDEFEQARFSFFGRRRVDCGLSASSVGRSMTQIPTRRAHVVGGGPAGLIAADVLSHHGIDVSIFEAMPSVGRKLLVAGVGGLNITHSEPLERFVTRYGELGPRFTEWFRTFGPSDLRSFLGELGIETIVGTSGRVFPSNMKAAPFLRAWIRRLRERGVAIHTRHRLIGLGRGPRIVFARTRASEGPREADTVEHRPDVAILALGGASWRRLGSDGLWSRLLGEHGITVKPFAASNCGFEVGWSSIFRARCEGKPLKNLRVHVEGLAPVAGELLITRYGLEGGALYALSGPLRAAIAASGLAQIELDLKPTLSAQVIGARLAESREKRTLSEHLRRKVPLDACAVQLLLETTPRELLNDPYRAAARIKAVPVTLRGVRPLDEAISSAGGVPFAELNADSMLVRLPGFFLAGEMLDYDPPTGGYLLQAAFTSGVAAALGALSRMGIPPGSTWPKTPGL